MRLGLLVLLFALPAAAQWAPFEMEWDATGPSLADVSFVLDKPAGATGFVAARGGHLYTGAGKRLRLWGVNFSFNASFPSKEFAPKVAEHLARFGVNCVRVHHHDWRAPRGLIDSTFDDSRHLDPAMLDRLDFLVAELKKRGIYTDLNLNVARDFRPADGVKDAGSLGFAKAITIYDPKLIELQKEFARAYLTHKNPYTGNEYRHEPAIALVELVNENSLLESWVKGRLRGKGVDPAQRDRTWVDIPASYEQDLTKMFGGPRLDPKDFAAADAARFQKEASFYMRLEEKFYLDMERFLKQELGVRMPIVAGSAHNGGMPAHPIARSTSKLDVVDAHTYWQHPRYIDNPATGARGFEITNTPQVDEPGRGSLAALARVAVAGKPFIVSEVNEPYPNEHGAEIIPLLAAYGLFQDWDGLFWYSFEHSAADNWRPRPPGHFDIRQDPVKMTQLAAAAVMFHRGDFQPARQVLVRDYSASELAESLRLKSSEQPWFTPGMDPALAGAFGVRIGRFDAQKGAFPAQKVPLNIVSDTRQLTWSKGLVTGAGERASLAIGRLRGAANAGRMKVESETPFGAVLLVQLDQKSWLLTAGARTSNKGMEWNAKRTSTPALGTAPMLIEPLKATITLKGFAKSVRMKVTALDGAGRPMGEAKPEYRAGEWRFALDQPTPWYRVSVD